MKLRPILLGAAALMLTACGSDEKYPVSATEATSMLTALGDSPAVSPMPAALSAVRFGFELLPDGNGVQWAFRNDDGEKLGMIVARVEPDGESHSKVTVTYVHPVTPITSHTGKQYRTQLEGNMRTLLAEAVDSTLEGRPFDMALRQQVELATVAEGFGGAIDEAHRKMANPPSKRAYEKYGYDTGRQSSPPPQPTDASKPSTDLSQFR